MIAHPSFSNDENLRVWYGFHAHLGERIAAEGREKAISAITAGVDHPGPAIDSLSYAVLLRRGDDAEALKAALLADTPDRVLLGYSDAMLREQAQAVQDALSFAGTKLLCSIVLGR